MKKIQIFDQNMDLPLSKIANFPTFLIRYLYCLERFIFYLERYERLFVGLLDLKNRKWKKFKFLTKTMDYPLASKNENFATFLMRSFYSLERPIFI